MARTVSDDEHICYVQDVVVHPTHHRQGVGRAFCRVSGRHHVPGHDSALVSPPDPRAR
ncbi:hypothetical protein [Streptomyces cinnamoneus]|uniref:hypothetical protein n=1 Tax=Streptomyces cinnamoneus TaxID=53446 RepID=UPI003570CCDC